MATKDADLYDHLKNTLYNNPDSATIGEAAAYGMGLVMVGSGDEDAIQEMISHATDNNHEKIIRGLGVSLALTQYGKEAEAEGLITQMIESKDSIIRYGAMFAIGCAYAGTASASATRRLLKFAISDTSDDVKRAALMNIGILNFRDPKHLPQIVKHMAVSYNPHLRYGAAMALGIGCAGTGSQEALRILAPLSNDREDFVKQGALIALSMVFIQITEVQESKVATIRKLFEKVITNKFNNDECLTKVGALISNGILNAAGRNSTIQMTTHDGNVRQNAVVGLVLFCQHWYWYPMLNFLSLALTPTHLIAVDQNLKVPKSFKLTVKATPATFKYPELMKKKETVEKKKVETAVLSTTTKVEARLKKRGKGEGGDIEMSQADEADKKADNNEESKDVDMKDDQAAADEKDQKKDQPQPTEFVVNNPCRMMR
jgi:26S proteasome regulatory subunit N2